MGGLNNVTSGNNYHLGGYEYEVNCGFKVSDRRRPIRSILGISSKTDLTLARLPPRCVPNELPSEVLLGCYLNENGLSLTKNSS